jgi:Raf kinase inhibitor-like YbhB/YbcL family protein
MEMTLTSSAFSNGNTIPEKYTADGENVSPPLSWTNSPANTKCFALIADDPDAPAGTWVHWVLANVSGDVRSLEEGVAPTEQVGESGVHGKNDFGNYGYGGPAPPPGKPHRYFFKLYALDAMLEVDPGASKDELLQAMQGHILGQAELMGKYQR